MVYCTVLLASYCFYCVARSIALVLQDTSLDKEPPTSYFDDLRRLDEYNLKGRVDKKQNTMVIVHFSREDSLIYHDRLSQRIY